MIQLNVVSKQTTLATLVIHPLTSDRIKLAQENDLELQGLMEKANRSNASGFHFTNDSLLRMGDVRIVICLFLCWLHSVGQNPFYVMLLLSQGCCFIQSLLFSSVLQEDSVKFSRKFISVPCQQS
jgi:uncharacterized membrane protein